MRKPLFLELFRMTCWSLLIFGILFFVLWLIETFCPGQSGRFLHWTDPAFVVGIPASILGTAYVLAIRNPKNYIGFYPGVLMALLLSLQFFFQEQYDLVFLYLCVFIPFQIMALLAWRKDFFKSAAADEEDKPLEPAFINGRQSLVTHLLCLLIVVVDYVAVTLTGGDGWTDNMAVKLFGALTIATSFFANYWMIFKKNDAWLCWVLYSVASIALFVLLGNPFSLVLFCVMLVVNASAQLAWLRNTDSRDFGWVGDEQTINWFRRFLPYKRGHIVDVVNRRIYDGEIRMRKGRIVSIRECPVSKKAPYILPGFVDSHIHIESTLLLPEQYAKMAVGQGTVAVITDPHEVANVLGEKGIKLMMDSAQKTRFHFYFGIPSCVPATPFETSGAHLDAKDVQQLLQLPNVYGLGEMMNVPGVLSDDPDTMAKIRAAIQADKLVDGHCPQLSGDDLKRYAAAGITVDHECTTLEEARNKIAAGMIVQIREGSAACDLDALMPILRESDDQVMFCSDDKYPDEISLGYINDMVVRCVRRGISLWSVLNAACVTPRRHYKLPQALLQVGDQADFICVHDLIDFDVRATYIDGRCCYSDDQPTAALMLDSVPSYTLEHQELCPNHFLAQPITEQQIQVPVQPGKRIKVIDTTEGSLLTKQLVVEPKTTDGMVVSDVEHDVLKLVCLSRHSVSEPQVGFISGFGLNRGAIASTIGHDSHNIIALGTNDEDIVRAINHLVKIQGGLVICDGPELIDMELPVAGLMSVRTGYQVGKRHCQLKAMAARLGCRYRAPFMTMAFMPLPVIPELKITDKGLFDATKFEFTSLFED